MELLIYKASAGSGKTFTLAVEYIEHLIRNPRAYRQILAVTFTNKATAEMKERIVQQLYGIWTDDPSSKAYLDRILSDLQSEIPDLTPQSLRFRAGQALLYMLHDYSRFRVETIDSFFQSVMHGLARELELSPNLNIELDTVEVLDEAVDSLIEKLRPDSVVLNQLLRYIEQRIADDKRWNVSGVIKSFARNLFNEEYVERGELLRHQLEDPQAVKLYAEVLHEVWEESLEQMKGFYDQFIAILEAHGLAPDELKNGRNGIGSYFRKLASGTLNDAKVVNSTLLQALESAENWASKTSAKRAAIVDLAASELMPLLRDAEALRPVKNRTANSCQLALQHLNELQLLNAIDSEVRTLNAQHNRFLLSDTNALLHRLVGQADSSFVFEKIGANIRHVMIDEFQDTSRMQWHNFRLPLTEGLSQGANSLIVGDVKQSIYRWRGGDWGILNQLGPGKLGQFPVQVKSLKVNRRSEANIIGFNNALFTAAVEFLNLQHKAELNEPCTPLLHAYADVCQESPQPVAKGLVRATLLEADTSEEYTALTLEAMAAEVQQLLESGVRLNDMAILVRKNKSIPAIADYFEKNLHLPVVSDEAFRLDASVAVCMLIDALRWLSNPADAVALTALTCNYHEQHIPHELQWHRCFTDRSQQFLPAALYEQQDELRLLPLYELLETLYGLLDLAAIEKQEAYLFSFFDAVTEYLQNHSSDLDSFLRHWDEKLCGKTIASGEIEGIRIFSIHKSKGLEFHTVLIPFCDWKLENETNDHLVWCTSNDQPFSALSLVPVNYSSAMAESTFRANYLNERLQLWVDSLNMLYVAFTRASKNLLLWSRCGQRNTIGQLLETALPQVESQGIGTWNADEAVFEYGELYPSAAGSRIAATATNRLLQKPQGIALQLSSQLHPVEFLQSNQSADFIAGVDEAESSRRFLNRGRLLHTLFSAIRVRQDIDDAIDRLLFDGILGSHDEAEELRTFTHRAFQLPQVQSWYSGQWQLFNECTILWQENGQTYNRRPDRVMMKPGQIVVVDFKFGKPRKSYVRQVKEYMDLLTRMGYSSERIEGYLWYVDNEVIEPVERA